ncbi:unnamed protein product, partial [Amoebophrya sp. A25]|eukprot:GSA25T00007997001.1
MSAELFVDFLKSFFSKKQRAILYGEKFPDQRDIRADLNAQVTKAPQLSALESDRISYMKRREKSVRRRAVIEQMQ